MANVTFRSAVALIPFPNGAGAKVLCNDGSVWELLFPQAGGVQWNDLKAPLPGSAAAAGVKLEHDQYRAGLDVPRPADLESRST